MCDIHEAHACPYRSWPRGRSLLASSAVAPHWSVCTFCFASMRSPGSADPPQISCMSAAVDLWGESASPHRVGPWAARISHPFVCVGSASVAARISHLLCLHVLIYICMIMRGGSPITEGADFGFFTFTVFDKKKTEKRNKNEPEMVTQISSTGIFRFPGFDKKEKQNSKMPIPEY